MNYLLNEFIPSDHTKKTSVENYVIEILKGKSNTEVIKVLDLGCGVGESQTYFTNLILNLEWIGLDIEDSPEVQNRKEKNEKFVTYDGIHIPFAGNYFDLIFCKQVFEHVKYPRELLLEISRVLKPGGHFIGSTSHLEPFHSYSYWNFTPYGFSILVQEVNLKLLELRPSIDALTLIIRRGLGSPKFFNIFFRRESPLNFIVSLIGKIFRMSVKKMNTIKLLFCGQFIFFVTKEK